MSDYQGLVFEYDKFHEIGPMRFPIMNDLLPAERKAMHDYEAAEAASSMAYMKFAKKIAQEQDLTAREVFNRLQKGDAENDDIVFDYLEEMQELNAQAPNPDDRVTAYTTLFMQTRGWVKLTPTSEYIRTSEWTEKDTEQIPVGMQKQVNQFIVWERDGWPGEPTEGNDQKSTSEAPPSTSTKPSSPAKSS